MKFTKLIIENYKSFQTCTEIDFTCGRAEQGRNIFLIGALNGVGKTSVLEAINICLYGEKRDNIFKAINRHQVAKGNFSCALELHIATDEGETVVVRRSWSVPLSVKNPQPKDLDGELSLTRNCERFSNPQVSQEYLHANFPQIITQFFFFDGEKIQQLADDAALGIKDDIEAALGIKPLRQLIKDLEYLRREESRDRPNVSDEEVQVKQTEISKLERQRKELDNERKQKQEDINNFNEEVEDKKKLIQLKYGKDPEKHEELRRLKSQRSELERQLSDVERQSRDSAELWLPLALLREYFPALRRQIDAERQARKQTAIQEQAQSLTDVVVKEVQTFEVEERQQPLTEAELQAIEERIFRVVREFVPAESEGKSIQELLQLSDADAAKIELKIGNIERKSSREFEKNLTERQSIGQRLAPLTRELEDTEGEDDAGDQLKQLLNDYHNYSVQMGRRRESLKEVADKLEDVDKNMDDCKEEIKLLREKCNESQKQDKFIKQIDNLISLLYEYIDRLRQAKIGQLRENTLLMYREIYRKGELISDIEIDQKSYIITIRDQSGYEVQKQNLSAGEKEVFAISLLWGLAETSQLSLPIVIDTPLSRLDSNHRKRIVNHYYPNAGSQIILLSTDEEVNQTYYQELEPNLQHAVLLEFDKERELTTLKDGYFNW